eukprot:gene19971-21926_t
MQASSNHFASSFKNNCVVRPRKPDTQLPTTELESSMNYENSEKNKSRLYVKDDNDELNGMSYEVEQENQGRDGRKKIYEVQDLPKLLLSDDKFYKHLQELRHENKKTLKMLEKFYRPVTDADQEKAARPMPMDFIEKMKQDQQIENNSKFVNGLYDDIGTQAFRRDSDNIDSEKSETSFQDYQDFDHSKEYRANASFESSDDSEEDPRKDWTRKYSHNILPDESVGMFRGRSSSYEVIDNMWDNFSVDSYAPFEESSKGKNKPDAKQWSPSITIPEPFQMTLRAAAKANVKSKRKEKLEQELLRKKVEEEAELNKKFRAKPAPATTFMQIYKENEAREQEKREFRRTLNKAILEATVKPFDFTKRDEKMKELRQSQSTEDLSRNKSETQFKATPFPHDLFNLSLEDKRAEQDEYRKIKIKMRSQETLAKSSLPPNMRARGERYTMNTRYQGKTSKEKQSKASHSTKSETFRPEINHEIPDYESLHRKFEQELQRKRRQATPTVCEPFSLHTGKVPSRSRLSHSEGMNGGLGGEDLKCLQKSTPEYKSYAKKDYRRPTPTRRSTSFNDSGSDDAPPFALTETARRRLSKAEQSLTDRARTEDAERKQAEQRRRRENEIRKQVARKSASNDLKSILQQQSKEKLQSFRESDLARAREYRQYLKELRAKVNEQPLLFERESQTNARKAAQKKYKQILQEAGVDDDVVDSLVNQDGNLIEAESNEDYLYEDDDDKHDENKEDVSLLPDDADNESEAEVNDETFDDGVALNTTHTLSNDDTSDNDKSL